MAREIKRSVQWLLMPTAEECQGAGWRPAADVYQTRRGWLVKLDLAGVRPDEISLEVCGRRLTVRGERRDVSWEEGLQPHSLEISYNRFTRVIDFPCQLDRAHIVTEYRDGMLLVQLLSEAVGT